VELRKLAAQVTVRAVAAVCLLGPFAFVAVLKLASAVPTDTLFGRWAQTSGFAVPLVVLGFAGSWGLVLVTSLVAGDIFASEDRYGTWKTVLTRSCSRADVFAGKALAAVTYSVAMVSLLAASSLAAGALVVGMQPLVGLSGTLVEPGRLVSLVLASWASVLVPMLGFTCVGLLFSVTTRSTVVGVLGPAVVGLAMQLVSLIGGGQLVRALLLTTPFDAWHGLFQEHPYYRPLEQGALVATVYAAGCLACAWQLFRRRSYAGEAAGAHGRWSVPAHGGVAVAAMLALLVAVSRVGASPITAERLEGSIAPTFSHLVVVQQRLLGRRVPAGSSVTVLPTCGRGGSSAPGRGAGDDWLCSLSLVGPSLAQQPVNYDVNVRANGCYTADGPPAVVGRLTLRGPHGRKLVNPLYQFDGCLHIP